MPSSHHCMAEERAGIAIQTHVKWRYRIITGKTITSASSGDAPRAAHMRRRTTVHCPYVHCRRRQWNAKAHLAWGRRA